MSRYEPDYIRAKSDIDTDQELMFAISDDGNAIISIRNYASNKKLTVHLSRERLVKLNEKISQALKETENIL